MLDQVPDTTKDDESSCRDVDDPVEGSWGGGGEREEREKEIGVSV